MNYYETNETVLVDDRITHHGVEAVVESLHTAEELAEWGLDPEPGFMIVCESCGHVLINPQTADWEDTYFVKRAA
jgi:hypothetical protein